MTTNNLFKKAAVFTDLHIGLKGNSIRHNEDCLEFVKWFIEKSKTEDCDVAIICGDWHNHRATINIQSLDYSLKCLELLNNAFTKVYFLVGNHDLYYRERRDVTSITWAKHLPNIHLINDIYTSGNVTLCPWLVGDEFKKLTTMKGKYLFGHFEFPKFLVNAMLEMPDHGEVSDAHVSGFEKVFSGHFHKRQARNNIWYIGNAFPHNYADAGDDARGMMILEWDKEPEFHAWPNQPKYRVYKLSEILDNPEGLLLPRSHVRVHLDIDISFEEASFIKETLIPQYDLREMTLIPIKGEGVSQDNAQTEIKFESVDQIILQEITNIESEFYDTKILLEIYKNL